MDNWTNDPGSATSKWSAPRLIALSAAGSAPGGVIDSTGLTENQYQGTKGKQITYGYWTVLIAELTSVRRAGLENSAQP